MQGVGYWTDVALHVLLPRACAHCREDVPPPRREALCEACERALPAPPEPACVRCAGSLGGRRGLCPSCAGRLFACRLVRAAALHRDAAASLVHAFKFRGFPCAARTAGAVMARRLDRLPELSGFEALVPVPAHPRRRRARGYNQAELLARVVGAATGLPLLELLERRRPAAPAWRLGRGERRAELAGAFAVCPEARGRAAGLRLLLIDDVCASATTLEECALALRRAGARDVAGYAFARA